jgi:hypothetical protein
MKDKERRMKMNLHKYNDWVQKEKQRKLEEIKGIEEKINKLDSVVPVTDLNNTEEILKFLGAINFEFTDVPADEFLDEILKRFNPKKSSDKEYCYFIDGFRLTYDNLYFNSFSLSNPDRMEYLKRMRELGREIQELYSLDPLKEETKRRVADYFKETEKTGVMEKQFTTFVIGSKLRLKGYKKLISEIREDIEKRKEELAIEYVNNVMEKLREAKKSGFLDFILELTESEYATVRIDIDDNSGYTRELRELIKEEFPEFHEVFLGSILF